MLKIISRPLFTKSVIFSLFLPLLLFSIGSSMYEIFGESPKAYSLASDYGVTFDANNNPIMDPAQMEIRWIHASRIEVTFLAEPANPIVFIPSAPIGDNFNSNFFNDRLGNEDGKVLFKAPGYNDCGDDGAQIYFDFDEDGGYFQNLNTEFDEANIVIQFLQSASADCRAATISNATLLDPGKSNDWFVWVSPTQIQTVEGMAMGQFTQDSTNPLYFVRDSESSSDCKDKLLLDTAANTVKLFELDQDFGGSNNGTDPPPEANAGAGCEMRENGGIPTSNVSWGVAGTSTDPAVGTFPTEGGVADDGGCEVLGGAFSFVLCPLLKIADEGFKWLDARIISALNVNSAYYDNEGVRGAWANLRNIAYILLIPILLIMVMSTALGFSFVDAYTVKRALPRLLVAIIFIALSFDIARLMIEVSNVVGKGTAGLIAAPFGGVDNLSLDNIFQPNAGSDVAFIGGAIVGGVLAFLGPVTIYGIAITIGLAVLAMIIVFVILTLREMLIVFLLIMAPVAILAWIFPGNDKLWKIWWQAFSKMLIFFPLIMGIIISGRAFASIIQSSGADEGLVITTIIKLVAFVGPYFFIPAAFKFAGGALGNLAGMVNSRGKGVFDRGKKLRGDLGKRKMDDLNAGRRGVFKGGDVDGKGFRGRMNSLSRNAYARKNAAIKGGLSQGFSSTARDGQLQISEIEEMDHARKDTGFMTKLKNDDFANAMAIDDEAERTAYLVSKGYTQDSAEKEAKIASAFLRNYGTAARILAVDAKAASKTSYTGGLSEMLEDIIRSSHGDEGMAMTMLGSASGAAMAAGRFDLGGGSYGEKAAMLKAKMRGDSSYTHVDEQGTQITGSTDSAEINQRQAGKALDGLTSWEISRMHPTAAKNVAQNITLDFQRSAANITAARAEASHIELTPVASRSAQQSARLTKLGSQIPGLEKAFGQKAAHIKTLEQSLSTLPPEVARTFAAGLNDSNQGPIRFDGQSFATPQEAVRHIENGGGGGEAQKGYKDLTRNPYSDLPPQQRLEMEQRMNGQGPG